MSWYWKWRFSPISRPWYSLLNWIHFLLHARQTAIVLDNCVRALSQMKSAEIHDTKTSMRVIKEELRHRLVAQIYSVLPKRKFRED